VITLEIVNQSGRPVPRKFLETWVRELSRELGREKVRGAFKNKKLTLAFVNPKDGRRLNREFRNRDYATDVLSFDPMESGSLGELVICPEVISRQAKEHGLLVREELGYIVLHGVLHLLGYDHEKSKAEAKRMFDLQDRVFERLLKKFSASI